MNDLDILQIAFGEKPDTRIAKEIMHHRYSVIAHGSVHPISSGISLDQARDVRDMLRTSLGGAYDIIETETETGNHKLLFSGQISQSTPHVPVYAPIDDPMLMEISVWDASWLVELAGIHNPVDIAIAAPTNQKPPVPPKTVIRKPRKSRSVSVEREYAGISDVDILNENGYVVIDTRSQIRCYSGTKRLCMEYIEKRNVPHSRDKLPLSCIKIIRYSEYPEYQAKVEAEGFVAHYRGNKIAVGLRAEVEKVIRALFPKTVNTKHLSVARASAVDLWWIQNRYDEMRKVAS